jgi:hypothetical protein
VPNEFAHDNFLVVAGTVLLDIIKSTRERIHERQHYRLTGARRIPGNARG